MTAAVEILSYAEQQQGSYERRAHPHLNPILREWKQRDLHAQADSDTVLRESKQKLHRSEISHQTPSFMFMISAEINAMSFLSRDVKIIVIFHWMAITITKIIEYYENISVAM